MLFSEAIQGTNAPDDIVRRLTLIRVPYLNFQKESKTGELVVHDSLADEIYAIFLRMWDLQFPIEKIIPIVAYNWDDEASMADNNTSAFNYRFIAGTETLSTHSFGTAIDINPRLNPYDGRLGLAPKNGSYNPYLPGTLTPLHPVTKLFLSRGWTWLGQQKPHTDPQHFHKLLHW